MALPEAKYFRMTKQLRQWIKSMAKKERRTEQEVITAAIEFYHEQYHVKDSPVDEARNA